MTRPEDRETLIDALKHQRMVHGNTRLAERIAEVGEMVEIPAGGTIIHQGADDNEVYLIVSGSFHIVVNGKVLARRVASDHVGEMAAILPVQRRAASVVAEEASVVVRLSDSEMAMLGDEFPQIWRTFARELAHRVEQRNTVASSRNQKTRVLIMAPSDESQVVEALKAAWAHEAVELTVWKEGSFRKSTNAIDSLERELDRSDVAIAVADGHGASSREHVIFELGFFMGRLGRHRTFLVEPHGKDGALPAELSGINTITWKHTEDKPLEGIDHAAKALIRHIHELGPNR